MKAKTAQKVPHRNPLVAAVMKKPVIRHGRSNKAERRRAKMALQREVY